jgi:3'-phosphoadenosine 5'-phosphosulfate sulfotransferase (PAPS reductase)/FAD synthetase
MLALESARYLARKLLAGRKVYASISGGKDSVAMGLYLKELEVPFERVFADTGWEHPALLDHLRGPVAAALGPITEVRGDMDFVELVRHKGMFPSRVTRYCTTMLKVLPIQKYLLGVSEREEIVNAVGIRRAESRARSQVAEFEWSESFDCEIWRPLVTWTKDDVLAIHARHGVPLAPLYDWGAGRVGCFPCIHASKKELSMVARVAPERIDLIETIEAELNQRGGERDLEIGREFRARSMFNYHGGDSRHIPITIREAVEWSNSKRGSWQPPGAGDGCMRWGFCETSDDT